MRSALFIILILIGSNAISQVARKPKARYIETLPWTEARTLLSDTTIVIIPLGAQSKEHGPHLQLRNDWLIADYLKSRIAESQQVVIYPTINYHFYPSFLEYAGSTSLRMETAYSLIVDICRVVSAHGPKKFYILNTGVSTLVPLKVAREILAQQGILMTYTDILHVAGEAEQKIKQQTEGTHADEIETSMMLYIAPKTVSMKFAARDIPESSSQGPLTLDPKNSQGRYSPTGIYGDATLATLEKGRIVIEAMVKGINKEIDDLRKMSPLIKNPIENPTMFTGTYAISKDETINIAIDNNRLILTKASRKISMLPQTNKSFTVGERGRIVYFQDETGTFSSVYFNWEGIDYLGKKLN